MNERELWWKIGLIGVACALAFTSVWPLDQKMKFGIDLYGGYSLLYEIDDTGLSGGEKVNLSERVMRVLRERVDPKGVFNLVWRPVGHNRLEIQMPRPSQEIRMARAEFEKHQQALRDTTLSHSDLMRALNQPADRRAAALDKLVLGIDARRPLMEPIATAYDQYRAADAAYREKDQRIKAEHLTQVQIEDACRQPIGQRTAHLDKLVGKYPDRRSKLEAAAAAWDEIDKLRSTTQPAGGVEPAADAMQSFRDKEREFDQAVRAVMALNPDPAADKEGVTLDQVVELEDKFNRLVSELMATNVDVSTLQIVLSLKRTDPARKEGIERLREAHPNSVVSIDGLVKASEALQSQRRGEGRLEDPADLQRLLRGAGVLEFRILPERDPGDPTKFDRYVEHLKNRGPRRAPGESQYQWFEIEDPKDFVLKSADAENLDRRLEEAKKSSRLVIERYADKWYVLADVSDSASLTHRPGEADWALTGARFERDENGRPAIGFDLDERGGDRFAVLTRVHKNHQLCIFLDDQAISHATIQSTIRTRGRITGSFTVAEVQEMVKKLDAGSLPRKLKDPPISVRSIGPSLGEANREAGLTAAKWGGVLVAVFMIGYYLYAGTIAVFAVAMNLLLTMAVMAIMGATLTLPGIAGLVLAIGMGVDANVLINERIREELNRGTAVRMSIKLGYDRAFSAILDSNLTTILTSIILYFLGSEEIKGFGLTLGVGVMLNLLTAYFATKVFFEVMSLSIIPKEVKRYPVLVAIGLVALGGLSYGLGYAWNAPELRAQSNLIAFGKTALDGGGVIVAVLAIMFVLRAIHRGFQRGEKPRLPMLRITRGLKINWVGMGPIFLGLSLLITVGGVYLLWGLEREELYDIEFLGGTAAQIDVRPGRSLDQQEVAARLARSAQTLDGYAAALANAAVSGASDAYSLTAPGIPAGRLEPVARAVLANVLSDVDGVRFEDPGGETLSLRFKTDAHVDLGQVQQLVARDFVARLRRSSEALRKAQVQRVETLGAAKDEARASYEIVTLETNKEIVIGGIMETMQEDLDIQPALSFTLMHNPAIGGAPYFPVTGESVSQLGLPIDAQESASLDLAGWKGAVLLILDKISPPQELGTLRSRLRAMRLQPGFETHGWRESEVVGLAQASGSERYARVAVLVADENYPLDADAGGVSSAWVTELAEPEVQLIQAALQRQTSLSQITQFDQQVSGEAKRDAYIALVLSWLAIVIYLWFRFGKVRWGFSAVVALIHDVVVALGMVAACHYLADTPIGKALLLEKFRIDLAMVAALLTVIGYSVNDTIIIFDRIRENRGRLTQITPEIVNLSVNQTLGRTILTGMTTLFTIVTMYVFGGPGIHGFNFAMLIGILTGTYSSFAIACQILVQRKAAAAAR